MVKQFASGGEFKHEKVVVLGLEPFDQFDDMLMLESHEGILSVHLLGVVPDAVLFDNLDRNLLLLSRLPTASSRWGQLRRARTVSGAIPFAFRIERTSTKSPPMHTLQGICPTHLSAVIFRRRLLDSRKAASVGKGKASQRSLTAPPKTR